jgi:hypothetical protein
VGVGVCVCFSPPNPPPLLAFATEIPNEPNVFDSGE